MTIEQDIKNATILLSGGLSKKMYYSLISLDKIKDILFIIRNLNSSNEYDLKQNAPLIYENLKYLDYSDKEIEILPFIQEYISSRDK